MTGLTLMSEDSAGRETLPGPLLPAFWLLPQPASASASTAATASAMILPVRIGRAGYRSSDLVEAAQERARAHHLGAVLADPLREAAIGGDDGERAGVRV